MALNDATLLEEIKLAFDVESIPEGPPKEAVIELCEKLTVAISNYVNSLD